MKAVLRSAIVVVGMVSSGCGSEATPQRKGEDPPLRPKAAAGARAAGVSARPSAAEAEAAGVDQPSEAAAEDGAPEVGAQAGGDGSVESDADKNLSDARQAIFKDPQTAYEKAKEAHEEEPSREALLVMANAACRLEDAELAADVAGQMQSEEDRATLVDLCRTRGVTVELPDAE